MRRTIVVLASLVLTIVVLVAAGGGYYSTQLLPTVATERTVRDLTVVQIDGDAVTLQPDPAAPSEVGGAADLASDQVLGLDVPSGYLRLTGPSDQRPDGAVVRTFQTVAGTPPEVGDRGDLQSSAYPDDPAAFGLDAEAVQAPGPLGALPGWRVPATGPRADRWVVFVLGRGAPRAEAWRAADIVANRAGQSVLVTTYRNGPGAPASPDGFDHFGDTEWQDLQAWLGWLQDTESPQGITLYGFSKGGGVVAACLRRCDNVDAVTGTVLDSPLLSMRATLGLRAREREIPSPLITPLVNATVAVSRLRGGPDFARLEHVQAMAGLDLPILAFHGRDDTSVPFAPTARLAALDPEQVTFVAYDGGHVRGWNVDPSAYGQAVVKFLSGR